MKGAEVLMHPIIKNMMEKKATIPTSVQPKLHIWDHTKIENSDNMSN